MAERQAERRNSLLARKLGRKGKKPSLLGDILSSCLNQPGLRSKMREQKILDAWDRVVGRAIAEVTQPARVRNRVLQVKVINSIWMQELQFHKPLMIQKLNEFLGDSLLQDLRFVLGGREEKTLPESEEGHGKRSQELSAEERERIEKEVSRLPDLEMREILFRLFARGLTSSRGKSREKEGGGR
jgi:predicted nucleic acid-binding Zn ribbon protein